MHLLHFICQVSDAGLQRGGEQLLVNVCSANAFFDLILKNK